MQKFNVGDLVCFGDRLNHFPYTIIHIHQAPNDKRVWYVCAYKGDIPYIKEAHQLTLHTAANQPVKEGLLRDLNLKPGDVLELVSFGRSDIAEKELCYYEGRKWTVGPEGRTIRMENGGWNFVGACEWVYRVVSRKPDTKYGEWKLGQPSSDIQWDDIQVSRDSDGEIVAYRVKIEPKMDEYETFFHIDKFGVLMVGGYTNVDTHKITFNTIDGEPDCSSVKMEKL